MIYLMKISSSKMIGSFDTISLAKKYLISHGIEDFSGYQYLKEVDDMSYISRISHVDGTCIFNNKSFWLGSSQDVYANYASHTVLDAFGEPVPIERFFLEMNNNTQRLSNIDTKSDEVQYNTVVGFEFICIFRQICLVTDLGAQSGLGVAAASSDAIPLIMTGSFEEAGVAILGIPLDDFFTTDRLALFAEMLAAADVITYVR